MPLPRIRRPRSKLEKRQYASREHAEQRRLERVLRALGGAEADAGHGQLLFPPGKFSFAEYSYKAHGTSGGEQRYAVLTWHACATGKGTVLWQVAHGSGDEPTEVVSVPPCGGPKVRLRRQTQHCTLTPPFPLAQETFPFPVAITGIDLARSRRPPVKLDGGLWAFGPGAMLSFRL